jgi:hypothetical protein
MVWGTSSRKKQSPSYHAVVRCAINPAGTQLGILGGFTPQKKTGGAGKKDGVFTHALLSAKPTSHVKEREERACLFLLLHNSAQTIRINSRRRGNPSATPTPRPKTSGMNLPRNSPSRNAPTIDTPPNKSRLPHLPFVSPRASSSPSPLLVPLCLCGSSSSPPRLRVSQLSLPSICNS